MTDRAGRSWGYWTQAKLSVLAEYLDAFVRASSAPSERVYLDAFAGEGSVDVQDEGADDVACGAGIDRVGVDVPYAFYFPDEDEFTTVDPKDEIDSDCERVQLVSDFGDPLMAAVAPRTVRARAITFENPCRPRRCRGEVRLRYGSPSRLAGRRSFGQRSSRVVVRPSPAAGRRLARGRPLRVSVRWTFVLADQTRDSRYRTTYRTSLAVPPATAPP